MKTTNEPTSLIGAFNKAKRGYTIVFKGVGNGRVKVYSYYSKRKKKVKSRTKK